MITDRQKIATQAFLERAHTAWHRVNGPDAPCDRCNRPEWVKRAEANRLDPKELAR